LLRVPWAWIPRKFPPQNTLIPWIWPIFPRP